MLFHVTMTHTEDNCPIYHTELMPANLESFENLATVGQEQGVQLHYFTMCGPEHIFFALLEADTLSAVSRYVFSIKLAQKIEIVPVEHLEDTLAMARAATEQS